MVCGYLACDAQPFNPLLDNLPPVITARNSEDDETPWLGQFIRLATRESTKKRAGGESVPAKLSVLMFIEVVRRHLANMPSDQAGWLAGLRAPFVGKALSLLHARPEGDWTIEKPGKDVGLSRSVLAERFADLCRDAAAAVPRQMADADCCGTSEQRQHQYCDRCSRNWLRIRGGIQPCLQENGGGAAVGLAAPSVSTLPRRRAAFDTALNMRSPIYRAVAITVGRRARE